MAKKALGISQTSNSNASAVLLGLSNSLSLPGFLSADGKHPTFAPALALKNSIGPRLSALIPLVARELDAQIPVLGLLERAPAAELLLEEAAGLFHVHGLGVEAFNDGDRFALVPLERQRDPVKASAQLLVQLLQVERKGDFALWMYSDVHGCALLVGRGAVGNSSAVLFDPCRVRAVVAMIATVLVGSS